MAGMDDRTDRETDGNDEASVGSIVFTYGAPFLGVLIVAVGIAAAVPGAYGLIQEDIADCGDPTIAVDSPAETDARFGDDPPATVPTLAFEDLSSDERTALESAITDPVGEAHVQGAFTNEAAFRNGTLVTYEGDRYYATVVADNPCFQAAPLQFPLGVFAIALGIVGILTPPAYRKLVELETGLE
jgi:hypothetical protein